MILEWNTSVRRTWAIWLQWLKQNILLPRIGWAISTAASNRIGITTNEPSTSWYLATTSNNYNDISMPPPHNLNIAVSTCNQSNTAAHAMTNRTGHIPPPLKGQHQTSPTCHWLHSLLRSSRLPHRPHGPQHNCERTSKRHQINDEKIQTASRLPCHPSQCNSLILRFQHDPQHSLQCIVPLWSQRTQSCVRKFFLGWKPDATRPIKLSGAFFTLCTIYGLLLPPLQRPNLVPSSLIANRPQILDSRSKKWATPNLPPPSIAIIPLLSASPTIPLRGNAHGPWRWDSSGLQMQLHKENLTSNISLGRKILQTTRVSTILVLTM